MTKNANPRQLSFSDLEDGSCDERGRFSDGTPSRSPTPVDDLPFVELKTFPPFDEIRHSELFSLSLSNNTSGLTHGLHRFPAKFIPQVPRWAFTQFGFPGATVLDPFMGSGTTLVEGLLHGVTTIGVDIDPLARFIARAKTDMPSSQRIAELGGELHNSWNAPAEDLVPPMSDVQNFGHWFSNDAWGKLQALLQLVQSLNCDEVERRFLLAVFSSILRWVSNADDQSQKTYVSGTNPKDPPETLAKFWRSFHRALRGLRSLEVARDESSQVVVQDAGDACSLDLRADSVDLVITSPPYLDSVDYMYNLMLEYFWLGSQVGVPTRQAFNELRRKTVGAKNPLEVVHSVPPLLRDLVRLGQIPEYRREATITYFDGMSKHFSEAARVMRPGSRYVLVIGNSRTKKAAIPVHDCLVRLASQEGFELEKAFAYRVRRHYMKFPRKGRGGIILIDWVIVLKKVDTEVSVPSALPLPHAILDEDEVAC